MIVDAERKINSQANMESLKNVFPAGLLLREEDGFLCLRNNQVPVTKGVIRFRQDDGYNSTFALQWNKFRKTQIDDENETSLTQDRFLKETGWKLSELKNKLVLEAGCGAGRFTRIMAQAGANLMSFDYSSAVDASAQNNAQYRNVTFMQCDIFDMPFKDAVFDYVFCHGVLQHTPSPEQAFYQLNKKVRPGGRISIDVYHKDGKVRPWKSKYLWRPITTRMQPEKLLAFLEWFIPKWLPFDTLIKRVPRLGNYFGAIIPCWNYFYTDLSREEKIQWAIMDTFDALAPMYDIPVTLKDVGRWFTECGYSEFEVREGGNGVVGNGVKPG